MADFPNRSLIGDCFFAFIRLEVWIGIGIRDGLRDRGFGFGLWRGSGDGMDGEGRRQGKREICNGKKSIREKRRTRHIDAGPGGEAEYFTSRHMDMDGNDQTDISQAGIEMMIKHGPHGAT